MSDNMKIWNDVQKTDPNHTKKVNQRGGFTAIDAHYQIMSATKQFGPIGVGWGYIAGDPIFKDTFVIVPVTLWHGERGNTFGPVYGCCEMFGKRPDSDAPKKAGTDGLTKLLSQLGFNADVFLKKFDDNKYVAEVTAEFAPKPEPKREMSDAEKRDAMKAAIAKALNADALDQMWQSERVTKGVASLPPPMQGELSKAYTDRMAEVSN